MTVPAFWIRDYQTCVQCDEWLPLCRWILQAVERAATEADEQARLATGTSVPLRGFLPLCAVRDKRRTD